MNKRIGIDLDHTVANYIGGVVPLIEEVYGLNPRTPVYEGDKIASDLPLMYGLDVFKDLPGYRDKIHVGKNLFRNLSKLEPGVEKLTHSLSGLPGVKVYMITARESHPVVMEDTRKWLGDNDFRYTDVFHETDKHELCRQMEIDVMYDDSVRQIVQLVDNGINVVVRDMPWNRDLGIYESKIKRVHNWEDALIAIRKFIYRSI